MMRIMGFKFVIIVVIVLVLALTLLRKSLTFYVKKRQDNMISCLKKKGNSRLKIY